MKLPGATQFTRVLRGFRYQLLLTYTLFALEMLGSLTRPYFLGMAVDGLLAGRSTGLIKLTVVHLLWLIIGTARHMYDTRTFTAIYTAFITQVVRRDDAVRDVSRLSAHSTLARQVVDFLEFDFNYTIEAAYNVIGSSVILYLYDNHVAFICFIALAPVVVLGGIYGRNTARLNRSQHDELEKQVDIISGTSRAAVESHYKTLRGWQIKLSDQEAWNFGATELIVLAVITGSLVMTTQPGRSTLQVGAIIVIYNYILKFAAGLETVPYTIQRLSALKDILRRMSPEATPI